MSPVGWKPRARQQFSASKTRICSSKPVAGEFQLKSGIHPFGWEPRAKHSSFSAGRAILRSSRTVAQQPQQQHQPQAAAGVGVQQPSVAKFSRMVGGGRGGGGGCGDANAGRGGAGRCGF